LGSGLATIAAPLLVASRTSDPLTVSAAFWLPWLLFALPGGVLVDRVDRRRLMIVTDWVLVAAMSLLAAAILTRQASAGLLYFALFIVNTGEVVFRSASQAMIPSVVPLARLERARVGGNMADLRPGHRRPGMCGSVTPRANRHTHPRTMTNFGADGTT
jgi:MFS family permease